MAGFEDALQDLENEQQQSSVFEGALREIEAEQGTWAERAATGVKNFFTGEDRMQGVSSAGTPLADIPEIEGTYPKEPFMASPPFPNYDAMRGKLTPGEKAVPGMFHESMAPALGNPVQEGLLAMERLNLSPDNIEWTDDLDPIVTLPESAGEYAGKQFWLNKPGASMGDAKRFAAEMVPFLGPGGAAGGLIKRGGVRGAIQRGGVVAGGMGGLSMGADKLVGLITDTDIPIDQRRAIFLGALGFTGEVGIGFGEKLFRNVMSKPLLDESGKLTKQGSKIIDKLGIPPEAITKEAQEIFQETTRAAGPKAGRESLTRFANEDVFGRGTSVAAAGRPAPTTSIAPGARSTAESAAAVAEARTLPVPVELTSGQATRAQNLQRGELQAESGMLGDEMQGQAMRRLAGQEEALAASGGAIREGMAGAPVAVRGEGAGVTLQAVQQAEKEAKQAVRAAYRAARDGTNLRIPQAKLEPIFRARDTVKRDFDLGAEGMDPASRAVAEIDAIGSLPDNAWIKMSAMAKWRARLNNRLSAGSKKGEYTPADAAILQMKNAYDDTLAEVINEEIVRRTLGAPSAVRGDVSDINRWMMANNLNRAYAEAFKDDRIIRSWIRGKSDITPEEAASVLLGANKLGVKGTTSSVNTLKKMLGEDSVEYQSLAAEAALQIMTDGTGAFNRSFFIRNWNQLKNRNQSLVEALFSKDQVKALNQLASVSKNTLYDPVRNAMNPSGTAITMMNFLNRSFGPSGRLIDAIIAKPVEGVQKAYAKREVQDSLMGLMPVDRLFPAGGPVVSGAAGAGSAPSASDPVAAERLRRGIPE